MDFSCLGAFRCGFCRWLEGRKAFGNQFRRFGIPRLEIRAIQHDHHNALIVSAGGHGDGEIASRLAVDTALQVFQEADPATTDNQLLWRFTPRRLERYA